MTGGMIMLPNEGIPALYCAQETYEGGYGILFEL